MNAPRVTEEFRLKERLRDGAAIDDHKGPFRSRGGLVKRTRNELFAYTCLALNEHRGLARRGLGEPLEKTAHRLGATQERAERLLRPERTRRGGGG